MAQYDLTVVRFTEKFKLYEMDLMEKMATAKNMRFCRVYVGKMQGCFVLYREKAIGREERFTKGWDTFQWEIVPMTSLIPLERFNFKTRKAKK